MLVLVRKRGTAFEAVIRALKVAGVPVAGADRLNIGDHIAVLDLVAAGRAALLPDDDLTLATALKSPLVGFTDEDLIRIAAYRGEDESLVSALRRHADTGDAAARRGLEALETWRRLAADKGPFAFFATLLGPMGGSIIVLWLGTAACFLLNSASFFIVVLALTIIRPATPPATQARKDILTELKGGLSHVRHNRLMLTLTILVFVSTFLSMVSSIDSGFTDVSPRSVFTSTGKKERTPAMAIFDHGLRIPNHAFVIGANAMMGIALAAIM